MDAPRDSAIDDDDDDDDDDGDLTSMDLHVWTELQYGHPIDHTNHTNQTATTQEESRIHTPPLDRSNNDPFAMRQGKNLSFSGITITTQVTSRACKVGKRSEGCKVILDNVWGVAPAGITTAIMGTYVHVHL